MQGLCVRFAVRSFHHKPEGNHPREVGEHCILNRVQSYVSVVLIPLVNAEHGSFL